MSGTRGGFDHDWLVIGSGFGGSVSALRLAEKGYRVGVLESGRRFQDGDLPRSTWDARRYFWAPRIGLRGIFRLSIFKDVTVVSGAGVGGGSLGYACTLYRALPAFYRDPQWSALADWERELAPHYDTAERMLGVTDVAMDDPADDLLRELGEHLGAADTYAKTRVGIYFGDGPGVAAPDPFFGGEGPARTGCSACGRCMVGCPHGAKNTLVKNYLWLAERRGATIAPERTVVDIRPVGARDGSEGYEVVSERSGAWLRRDRRVHRARGVVVAAGALGTNRLLQRCRLGGSLPRLSPRLGELVRTNSEAILAVTLPGDAVDLTRRVAISGSIYPDPQTHIETVTYGHAGDAMSFLYTALVGDGTRVTRPLKWLAAVARHPLRSARLLWPFGWSRRTIILLVMQSLDNAIALRARRTRGGGVRLQTEQDPERPNPTFIPVANEAARWLAARVGGVAQSSITEALANIPTTAHILGGAVIGAGPDAGVVDAGRRAF
ncbi:MAG TPA: GMC family oxidoreductase N-terminal domain-containing protein, partial [Solirubrobacteraceae bacterium]|nr:GMC family oxidoreductase N-terminal domain-containing protein [Solirubrobacteraceae bacterium]